MIKQLLQNNKVAVYLQYLIVMVVATSICVPEYGIAYDTQVLTRVAKSHSSYTRLFYYRDTASAKESLFSYPESIDIVAPQSYMVNENAELEGTVDPDVISFSEKNNIKVMPLITNKNFGQKSLDALLHSDSNQDKLIHEMVNEARKNGFIGWQVDFEQMNVSYKDLFTTFIKKMADTMHKENLVVSVAVIAKISDVPSDYKKTLWNDLIGVYDYKALSEVSDFISIMSYDAPDSKGPIAPYKWLKQVIDYSMLHIPADKISLGIGLYYWKWDDASGKLTGIGGFEGFKIALTQYNPKLGYSPVEKAPYMKYTRKKKKYTIWYENEVSVKEKINLITKYRLQGFSAWALGLELPAIHFALKD